MYAKAGVSGPSEFGDLPETDQIYWNAWLEKQGEKATEAASE